MKRKKPPKTYPKTMRFCIVCNKIMPFKYNPNIFHSDCTECGCKWSRKEPWKEGDAPIEKWEKGGLQRGSVLLPKM